MNPEIKACQNCKNPFTIEPEDFAFYEKIKVPPPTWCPECRLQRRFAFDNAFHLYKRACDLCGKEVVSRYSLAKKYRVYCPLCWWSDKWDAVDYGRDYDFSRSFFEQLRELWHEVPLLGLSVDLQTAIESPYTNDTGHLKECYLLFVADYSERSLYGYYVTRSNDCVDSIFVQSCESSYDLFHAFRVYRGIGIEYSYSCNDSAFLWQCVNCQNCFASANLRNKQYYLFNQPYTREGYFEKIREYDLGSYKNYVRLKEEMRLHRLKYPVKTFFHEFSTDTTGLFVHSSRNCKNCFEIVGGENCKYVSFILTPTVKDSYDYTCWGDNAEMVYEGMVVGEKVRNVQFGDETGIGLYDAYYTKLCTTSSNLFGCISMRTKSYCILNKQYTKAEYENLIPKIIAQMHEMPYRDATGRIYRYGEFFPAELSAFAYNETLAQQYYPLTKEKASAQGYAWKEEESSRHTITIRAQELPDHIRDVSDDILKESIACGSCGKAYRLIPQELAFYRNMNIPVPRQCFYCRLNERMKDQPHPMRLWKRVCQCAGAGSENDVYHNTASHHHGTSPCRNEFETSYVPERPEIVYCEPCYQQETV
ncbi:MAG: Uncharacterized protein G01um101466_619 [Parcubacteria group bacterium Gr01-1014_66]|nr:MAG: Uncharacterized protein G01um101466_619 [Parcubacteria group bacterium Gr01-1014_66]